MKETIGLAIFGGVAVLNSLFMAGVLLINSRGLLKNQLIGLIFLSLSVRIGKSLLIILVPDVPSSVPAIGLLGMVMTGPLLWFYAKALRSTSFQLVGKDAWHLVLFLITFALLFINSDTVIFWLYVAAAAQMLIYLLAASRYAITLTVELKKQVFQIIACIGIVWLIYTSQIFIESTAAYLFTTITATFVLYTLLYLSFQYHKPFQRKEYDRLPENIALEDLREKLINLMEKQQLFKEPDLTAAKVAQQLHVKPYILSTIINMAFEKTFPEFVNGYRLREAEQMLHADKFKHYSIEAIAFESGFNTPSAFYAYFKKLNNCTPSEYRTGKNASAGKALTR
jgi:AraC-like DNA-binding protein